MNVPVIELSLSDNSIKIELADANVVSDYRNGADLCIFVNKSLTQKLCVHVVLYNQKETNNLDYRRYGNEKLDGFKWRWRNR